MTKPRSTLAAFARPSCSISRLPSSIEVLVGGLPQLVALEAEVLHADRGLGLVRDHPGAPGAEVLDPADLHVGLVDVDPVVREQVLAVDDQRDRQEVAVAQALGRGLDRAGRGGAGEADRRAQRQRRDDLARLDPLAAGLERGDAAVADLELGDGRVHPHLAAVGDDLVGHRLPHLPRAEARVVELVDQRLDVVLVAEERGLGGREERQALDALGGPLGADLVGRHAPHLLGVGHEEVLVEPLAEAVGDPLLEVVLAALGRDRGPRRRRAGSA